jgi:hypothetical protein
MFSRKGILLCVYKSALPGGNKKACKNYNTILDGIWLKDKNTCYILDLLVWSNQNMINCEVNLCIIFLLKYIYNIPSTYIILTMEKFLGSVPILLVEITIRIHRRIKKRNKWNQ